MKPYPIVTLLVAATVVARLPSAPGKNTFEGVLFTALTKSTRIKPIVRTALRIRLPQCGERCTFENIPFSPGGSGNDHSEFNMCGRLTVEFVPVVPTAAAFI
jgi:hypothetical protein